ncbi:outer membrane protein assembly factor BamE (lipoprotein component of BamABCDE complex) [Luteibacter sp. Sphag1AF]|uniref:hypothetical protein n=1 Tax=Luteibacter sp. Sphag1AF TaxID=2587031 RepID=UPI00160C24B1|nr:hypothetical protein [Luteibacter sp. Sphag1AF]MBB3228037.1 outer membrane protein assembly factor BamE (lipoprotein component of BamABCDE complex) [Luteibacter sp. Sphag1AF]
MKRLVVTLALTFMLAACQGMGTKVSRLSVGMPREEVMDRLGQPDAVRTIIGFEVLSYLNRHRSRFSLSSRDYTVVLKDGKVTQFGPGLVQRDSKTTLVIEEDK